MEGWKLAGLFGGMFIGGAPILSASWTWFRKQVLGVGGLGLVTCGSIIVVVAVAAFGDWKLFRVKSDHGDWSIELQKAKAEIEELRERLQLVQKEAARIQALETQVTLYRNQILDEQARVAKFLPVTKELQNLRSVYADFPKLKTSLVEMGEAQLKFLDWGIHLAEMDPAVSGPKASELKELKLKTMNALESVTRQP